MLQSIKIMNLAREKAYHLFFEIGVIAKAVIAAIETVAGIFLIVASPAAVNGVILWIVGGELAEDPRDFLFDRLIGGFHELTPERQAFWAFIALSHGIVKLALLGGLLKHKLWSYPASAAVFGLFVVYQIYDMTLRASIPLALVTAFDIVVILLILHEYRHRRRAGSNLI